MGASVWVYYFWGSRSSGLLLCTSDNRLFRVSSSKYRERDLPGSLHVRSRNWISRSGSFLRQHLETGRNILGLRSSPPSLSHYYQHCLLFSKDDRPIPSRSNRHDCRLYPSQPGCYGSERVCL